MLVSAASYVNRLCESQMVPAVDFDDDEEAEGAAAAKRPVRRARN
jgi:hypothetical protein